MPNAPKELLELQEWFSDAVTNPSETEELRIKEESSHYVSPSSRQSEYERVSIYTLDYWPRCLQSLKEDFSVLANYFAKETFFEWTKKYLIECPPSSFTLYHLGKDLYAFFEAQYQEDDRELVLEMIAYDWARMEVFLSEQTPPLDPQKLNESEQQQLLTLPLKLHPSLRFLALNYAITDKEPQRKSQYLIISKRAHLIKETVVPELQFRLFKAIEEKGSILAAIESVSENLEEKDKDLLEKSCEPWFADSINNGWFSHPKKGSES